MKYTLLPLVLACTPAVVHAENANERMKEATTVVQEMMNAGDKGIPQELLEKAKCAIIIPGAKKGGFFVGAHYGRGFAICRNGSADGWGAPAAVRMEGGSIGLQIGAAESDIFMLVMNDDGMKRLLDTKFTLDARAGVAAGPVGRSSSARTDASLSSGILAWSRSRGAFAGLTLGGGTLRSDVDENAELYGQRLSNSDILLGKVKPPESAAALVSTLNRFSRGEAQRARPAESNK